MQFKAITIEDYPTIQPYLSSVSVPICEFSFLNLYGWAEYYSTEWTILHSDILVIRFKRETYDHPVYMLPQCPCDYSRSQAIDELMTLSKEDSMPLVFYGVTRDCALLIEQRFPGDFIFVWSDLLADYLYTRDKLLFLKGKKLQPKRNHINQFDRLYPNHLYAPLTYSDVLEYKDFLEQWYACQENIDASMIAEQRMVERVFAAFGQLDLLGGVIRVDGHIVALTIASQINPTTVDVHIEKALPGYKGLYAKINHSFVQTLPKTVEMINREEDLGIPGLRKAKESYQPDLLLEKGRAIFYPIS